jgi:hypothetical protein
MLPKYLYCFEPTSRSLLDRATTVRAPEAEFDDLRNYHWQP